MRAERCSAKSRFSLPLCPIRGKVPFLSCSCSAFRKGKKSITSDALFADLLLSPPSLRDTSPYHKGRQGFVVRISPYHKGRHGVGETHGIRKGIRRSEVSDDTPNQPVEHVEAEEIQQTDKNQQK